jgi:predicted DCC family thiol-disulfide oxidoreductase YuxK
MSYIVVYDGNCNLCVSLVQWLEHLDQGNLFHYVPMQAQETLTQWGITPDDCELGMILLDPDIPERRWQGSAAAEEMGRLLPLGSGFVAVYRSLPGMQWMGDRLYDHVRDHRYALFGKRSELYEPRYPACASEACRLFQESAKHSGNLI